LQNIVIDQVVVIAIGNNQAAQLTPVELTGPFSWIDDVDSPLVGQWRVKCNISLKITLPQQI